MGLTDIRGVTAPFFITTAVFLVLILSAFSIGILRFFQGRHKPGIISVVIGFLCSICFGIILTNWPEM